MTPRAAIRLLIAAALAGALALSAAPSASAAGACQSSSAIPGHASRKDMSRATLCLLNAERRRRGMRPLKMNRRLSRAARRHSLDMARRNYFSHTSPSGSSFVDRIRRAGYLRRARKWTVGENLAWGVGGRASAAATMRAWMNSPGHRRNILTRRFREIGIGISFDAPQGGFSGATYATTFGARR